MLRFVDLLLLASRSLNQPRPVHLVRRSTKGLRREPRSVSPIVESCTLPLSTRPRSVSADCRLTFLLRSPPARLLSSFSSHSPPHILSIHSVHDPTHRAPLPTPTLASAPPRKRSRSATRIIKLCAVQHLVSAASTYILTTPRQNVQEHDGREKGDRQGDAAAPRQQTGDAHPVSSQAS